MPKKEAVPKSFQTRGMHSSPILVDLSYILYLAPTESVRPKIRNEPSIVRLESGLLLPLCPPIVFLELLHSQCVTFRYRIKIHIAWPANRSHLLPGTIDFDADDLGSGLFV